VQTERTADEPTGSSDSGNSVSEVLPDPEDSSIDPANTAVSSEQTVDNEDVELPTKEVPSVDVETKTDEIKANE
jgi:hypothetical protein